jgi:co-chaperonin GroES (HSP10)
MIEKLQAIGVHVIIQRNEADETKNGFVVPDMAQKKPAKGKILAVGDSITSRRLSKATGKTAVFNQHAGFIIELEDGEVTILTEQQVIAVL